MKQSIESLTKEMTEKAAIALKSDKEVSKLIKANTRNEFSFIAFKFRRYVSDIYVKKVYESVENEDDHLKELLGELARVHGDQMEKKIALMALKIAFPPQIDN